MQNKTLQNLINRGIALGGTVKITYDKIGNVEKQLNITLPKDFKEICINCSYESFYLYSLFNFETEVIRETLEIRKEYHLPNNYLILDQDDPGPILMKITSNGNAEVIMCSYRDFLNICDGKPYEENPIIFPTFADFYSFLLDEEEKMREEEKTAYSQS